MSRSRSRSRRIELVDSNRSRVLLGCLLYCLPEMTLFLQAMPQHLIRAIKRASSQARTFWEIQNWLESV